MAQLLKQLRDVWKGLSAGRKASFMALVAVSVAAVGLLSWWGSRPEWRLLYSNISVEDAGQIVGRLKEGRVQYRIGEGGASILVPADNVYETRMFLAESGLPTGGMEGFELFDKGRLGMTDFQNKISYQRALQGELSRTIGGLSEVEKCRVHLVIPEESLFAEKERNATASVVLKLKPGSRLTPDQVDGIAYLVASAVDQLEPERVTILDQDGKLLSSRTEPDSSIGMSGSRLELKNKFERDLEGRLTSMIEHTVGNNKVVVRVNADMDFSSTTKVLETYDPRGQVVRSEQTVSELSSATEKNVEGAPGVESNVPQGFEAGGSQNEDSNSRKTNVTNYEVSKTVSQVVGDGPVIKRLSVAVMVDGKYEAAAAKEGQEATGELKYAPRNDEELGRIESLVKSAIGFDETRGDSVSVVNIPFETSQPWTEEAPATPMVRYMPYIRYGLMALAAVAFVLLVLRPMIRWITTEGPSEAEERLAKMLPAGVKELETAVESGGITSLAALMSGSGGALAEGDKTDIMDRRRNELEQRRRLAIENAKQDPKAIIQMIRKWLREDQR